ncbi:hypothetical protein [Teredinibacter sp. KSP-S5-2]|uniref:hypothetical protein n=1 Tax=Teredinibacter sp. KSP-S5-2 TaxID=3034506 RepID=UPI0029343F15|nr:hypothetical protein [Teredinibacter sp. KSP-S5-2]WNO11486.1 hypothetical protein P5V12_09910 [Teredinibacter sp. KSP-S5-2]
MNIRVNQLDLDVDLANEYASLKDECLLSAQRVFIPHILEALSQRLHHNFGADALIKIRQVDIQWSLDKLALEDNSLIQYCAQQLCARIEQQVLDKSIEQRLLPDMHDEVIVFNNCAHYLAVLIYYLTPVPETHTTLTPEQIWFDEPHIPLKNLWSEVRESTGDTIVSVMKYLDRMAVLEQCIELLEVETATRISQKLKNETDEPVAVKAKKRIKQYLSRKQTKSKRFNSDQSSSSIRSKSDSKINSAAEREKTINKEEINQAYQLISRGKHHKPPIKNDDFEIVSKTQTKTNANSGESELTLKRELNSRIEPNLDGGINKAENNTSAENADTLEKLHKHHLVDSKTNSITSVSKEKPPVKISSYVDETEPLDDDFETTQVAGLAYLINILLRMELPEILWCAGLDERLYLHDIFQSFTTLFQVDDRMPEVLSGYISEGEDTSATLEEWADSEIKQKVRLRLQKHLLSEAQLIAFNNIQSQFEPWFYHAKQLSGESLYCQNVAWNCATLIAVFFILLEDENHSRNTLEYFLMQSGGVYFDEEKIDICMSSPVTDIRLRRAGLDINPGYLPWLEKQLEFSYPDSEEF